MNDTFVNDLLKQANYLACLDLRKPKQANLRRAVSASYYALFHFLITQSVQYLVGLSPSPTGLNQMLARAYDHGEMKDCCKAFSSGSPPNNVARYCSMTSNSSAVKSLCTAFTTAQEKRHEADYDSRAMFNRKDTLALITQVNSAITSTRSALTTDEMKLLLNCLPIWNKIKKR